MFRTLLVRVLKWFPPRKRTGIAKGSRGYIPGLFLPNKRVHGNRRSYYRFSYRFRHISEDYCLRAVGIPSARGLKDDLL